MLSQSRSDTQSSDPVICDGDVGAAPGVLVVAERGSRAKPSLSAPFQEPVGARRAVRAARAELDETGHGDVLGRDLLLVAIVANVLRHLDIAAERRPDERWSPDDVTALVRRAFDWLARTSREPWDGSKTSAVATAYRAGGFERRSVLATAARSDARPILAALFGEIAGPDGALSPDSCFARPVSADR